MTTITPELARRALDIPWGRGYVPHAPHAPQHAFCWLTCYEALYGGAAGGGKSDALLMAALQYVDRPGYAALLLRRTYADLSLPGALMDRAQQWLAPTPAKWNADTKTWHFPSGASLTFGYLENVNDKYRYQGAEFQFIGFDEATQFPESDYTYLISRLRRLEGSTIPLRMRAASNPGGRGHAWVKRRFVDPASRGERIFLPAKLHENPSLDQDAYRRSLQELDDTTREQLLNGDWDVRELNGREFFDTDHAAVMALVVSDPIARGWLRGVPRTNGKIEFTPNVRGPVAIWEPRRPSRSYLVAADTAGGISEEHQAAREHEEGDLCAAYVIDRQSGAVVAEFHQHTDADLFAADLARLGWVYRDPEGLPAEIFCEDNNAGVLTLSKLRDEWRYPRIYHREVLNHESRGERTRKIGWNTSEATRPVILAQLAAVLRDAPERLRSDALLAQIRTFVWSANGRRGQADVGAHDDLVMAAAIGCQAFAMRAVARAAEPVEAPEVLTVRDLEALLPKRRSRGRTMREQALAGNGRR